MQEITLSDLTDDISIIEIVSNNRLDNAWRWLLSEISPRPNSPGNICLFDHKCWRDDTHLDETSEMLAILYIASQLGDHKKIIGMVNGLLCPAVIWQGVSLDNDVQGVIESEKRFRNHLSEHLAFWIRLAVERKNRAANPGNQSIEFSYSKPNIQPEDKGSDGLYVEITPSYRIEMQSVKNNLSDPKPYISSTSFRNKGTAQSKKLLDDFWRLKHKNDGLVRLEQQLDGLIGPLGLSAEEKVKLALVQRGAYNAVIVANDFYANENLFEGYEHVTSDKNKRIATYIGSKNWKMLASKTWKIVKGILSTFGVLP